MREKPIVRNPKIGKKNPLTVFSSFSYTKEEIDSVNRYVYSRLSERLDGYVNRVLCYRNSDIEYAVNLYDELLLDNRIKRDNRPFTINISHKKNQGSGRSGISGNNIQLTIYMYKFTHLFKKKRSYSVGERCFDRLECILETVRHELVHILTYIYADEKQLEDSKHHGKLFRLLFRNIFNGTTTKAYSTADVDIYPERGKVVGKTLKKGEKYQLISKKGLEEITLLETPITYENEELIKVRSPKGTQKEVKLLFIKSPPSKSRNSVKRNTILSPISSKQYIQKKSTLITKEGYPYGLGRQHYREMALKKGVPTEEIPKKYKDYLKETGVFNIKS